MRYLYALAAAILAAATLAPFFPTAAEAAVYDGTLRLHVIAASDSAADQATKLAVRDAILAEASPLLAGCRSRDEAEARLRDAAPRLETVAAATAGQPAALLLGEEDYPTRSYATAALPAGEYLSLRIVLGAGAGRNWWCVLFPPLCVGAATDPEALCVEAGLTPEAYRIITAETAGVRYRVKFKLLEWLGAIVRSGSDIASR